MHKNFHFSTLWIWLFGIFDKRPQGCYEVKNSLGHLQGPRLMAWTTKSPIRENRWVPWGCRAHLGSVKQYFEIWICLLTWQENRLLSKTFIYDFYFYYTLFSKKPNFWQCIINQVNAYFFYGSFKISWYLYFRFNGNTLDAHTEEALTSTPNIESSQAMSIFSWFKEYQLYQIAVIYMSSRFFNNIRSNFSTKFTNTWVRLRQ